MLTNMKKEVEMEGERNAELFEDYMCYCKSTEERLMKQIFKAKVKIPQILSKMEADKGELNLLTEELDRLHEIRKSAREALKSARALRQTQEKSYTTKSADSEDNIRALEGAVKKLSKGLGGFLQVSSGITEEASVVQKLSLSMDISDHDRDLISRFLSGSENERPGSSEIIGIMKQMLEDMKKDQIKLEEFESNAKYVFEELSTSKELQIESSTKGIETKQERHSELRVKDTELKNDAEHLKVGVEEDEELLATTKVDCKAKDTEYAKWKESHNNELQTITSAVKIMNQDIAAIRAFEKKGHSAAFLSFLQVKRRARRSRRRNKHRRLKASKRKDVDLLELGFQNRKAGFEPVIEVMDRLIVHLRQEQEAEDTKRAYCKKATAKCEKAMMLIKKENDDMQVVLAEGDGDLQDIIQDMQELGDSIVKLDEEVTEATTIRKHESKEVKRSLVDMNAAKGVLDAAVKRLKKYFTDDYFFLQEDNSTDSTSPGPNSDADDDLVEDDSGDDAPAPAFVQVDQSSKTEGQDEGGNDDEQEGGKKQAPELELKSGGNMDKGRGIVNMIVQLRDETINNIETAEFEEQQEQKQYEEFLAESKHLRETYTKSLADKEGAKAMKEEEIQTARSKRKSVEKEFVNAQKELWDIQQECQWLLEHYDVEARAREDEIVALNGAKTVLSG